MCLIFDAYLDYDTYLTEINKLSSAPTMMIEHLNEAQLIRGLKFIYRRAAENNIVFEGSENRGELSEENASEEYFAPHQVLQLDQRDQKQTVVIVRHLIKKVSAIGRRGI